MSSMQHYFKDDSFRDFYNLDGLDTVVLTTDIDWAPDYATEAVLNLVAEAGMKITAYATHDSPLLKASTEFVEIGLHPDNTRPDPVHRFARKLPDLMEIFPDAVGLRCHRNFFGQNISDLAKECGLRYDLSTFLWRQPFAQAHVDYNGLVKMAYVWEDGIHVDVGEPLALDRIGLDSPGLKVLNVHPMLIYLNAPDDHLRRRLTKGIADLTSVPSSHFESGIHTGYGLRDFYRDLLAELKRRGVRTVFARDVVAAVAKQGH
jgi:peptidoglycan/xylan/chitin deacetylase (PgdA/CDA1 family)